MEVSRGIEGRVVEASHYDLASVLGHHRELPLISRKHPAVLGDFGMTGAANEDLVLRRLDFRSAATTHVLGMDVMHLEVMDGSADVARSPRDSKSYSYRSYINV